MLLNSITIPIFHKKLNRNWRKYLTLIYVINRIFYIRGIYKKYLYLKRKKWMANKMKNFILFLLLFTGLNIPTFAHASNSIFIPNIQRKQAIDTIVENKINEHWNVLNVNDYAITLKRNMNSMLATAAFGTGFNPTPEERLQFNVVQKDNGIIISVDGQIVTNPQSGYEHGVSYGYARIQEEINELTKIFLGYYTYGIEYGKLVHVAIITKVKPHSFAYRNGLEEGNAILTINNRPIKEYTRAEIIETSKPTSINQELQITYRDSRSRKSKPKSLVLKSEYIKPTMSTLF